MVVEGDVIHLKPSALDPDAKQITYEYSGWKETYDERYRLGDDDCAFDTVENIQNCVERIEDVVPNNWTESSQYQSTFKEAAITTNESDIGPHKVNITARDISGLIDYQTINLLVFDLPTVNISINPLYPDVPENILSVEDPFTFDGTDSAPPVIGGEENTIVKYEFLAQKESSEESSDFDVEVFNEETNEDKSYLDVPEDVSGSFTIENIKNKVLNDPVIHRLTLTIYALVPSLDPSITLDASDSVDVTVKECVPYRADSLPFPYNTNSNPFLANHSCCGGEIQQPESYQLLDSDNTCYFKDGYSYLGAAFDEIQELNKSVESIDHDFTLEFSEGNINDIYKLEFERACDGTRGNICAGDVYANLQVYEECNFEENFDEQCSGPPNSLFLNFALSCINYEAGSTFESQIVGSGEGRCYQETACSTRGGEYGDGGVMSCKGGCDGEGGCTQPLDCVCDMTACGAECDGTQSVFEEIEGEFICNHECETAYSCQFETQTILPCQPGNSCLRENFNSNNDKYCYFDVSCSDDTSNFQRGQTCQDPGTQIQQGDETLCVTENFNKTQYSECTDNGECNRVTENLNDYLQEFGECDEEQVLNCTNSGWECVDE
jgi:hypothetical protein